MIWDKSWRIGLIFVIPLLGCNISGGDTPPTPGLTPVDVRVETHTPLPMTDVSGTFAHWCFAALEGRVGQRLVIQDEASLTALYDFADSQCEEVLPRPSFDFTTQALVVVVDAARACRAEYVPTALENGRLVLQFVHEGTCPYDLVVLYAGTLTRSGGEIQVIVDGA